jgi:hypothetical protein
MLSLDLDAPRDASRDVPLNHPVQRISYEEGEEHNIFGHSDHTVTISNSTHHQQQQTAAAPTINNTIAHHHHSQYAGSGIFLNTQ